MTTVLAGIAHVYYIGWRKPVQDTYKADSLLFGNAGGAGFHSFLLCWVLGFQFKTVFEPVNSQRRCFFEAKA